MEDLPPNLRSYRRPPGDVDAHEGDDPNELVPLSQIERRYILRVMRAVGGNKARAARILGLDRKTLYRRLEHYGEEATAAR